MTPRQHSAHMRKGQHLQLYCDEKRIEVELHWRYGSPRDLFPLKFHDAWKKRQTVQLGGTDVAALSLEHTILFLCTHGAYHAWFRMFLLNDLARFLLKYPAIDWSTLMISAGQLGIRRMVTEGVIIANRLLGSPLPQQVLMYTEKDKGVLRLVKMSFYLIKCPDRALDVPFTPAFFYNIFHRFMLQNDPRYKLSYCLGLIRPSAGDWEIVPLPDAFFPLYYVVRPFTWSVRWYVRGTKTYSERPTGGGKSGAT